MIPRNGCNLTRTRALRRAPRQAFVAPNGKFGFIHYDSIEAATKAVAQLDGYQVRMYTLYALRTTIRHRRFVRAPCARYAFDVDYACMPPPISRPWNRKAASRVHRIIVHLCFRRSLCRCYRSCHHCTPEQPPIPTDSSPVASPSRTTSASSDGHVAASSSADPLRSCSPSGMVRSSMAGLSRWSMR